ncbi:MAG: hypothetical protein EG823_04305 [Actinobacteria bacterium]|nr:hypothetical protein [Actinomycetota bacterium]
MGADLYEDLRVKPHGSDNPDRSWKAWVKARRTPLLIAAFIVAGLGFAAGWNPPTTTVHSFSEASDYSARRESGCTNSGDGCHGSDERYQDFNRYHPDTECNICHEYTGVGCIPCHGPSQRECTGCHDGSMEGASDCVRLIDPYPKGHYRGSLHEAIGTDMKQVMLAAPGGEAKAACKDCHARDLQAAHTGVPEVEGSDYGTEIGCYECHNDEQSGALKQVQAKWKKHRCEDCHGEKTRSPMHAIDIATVFEATGESGCGSTGEGCHGVNDLHALHPDVPATCSGAAAEGEPGCHDLELQSHEPTVTACATGEGSCHPAYVNDDYSHKNDSKVHTASVQGSTEWADAVSGVRITCASCHRMDLTAEHTRAHVGLGADACVECHNKNENTIRAVRDSWPDRLGADACATCHDSKHEDADAVHTAVQLDDTGTPSTSACVQSGCHATADVRVLHAGVGCANSACHSSGGAITGMKMTCGGPDTREGRNCHSNSTRHVGAHDALEAGMAGTKSSACTACHGSQVFAVAAGEHRGCLCHTYGVAKPGNRECAACHKGLHGPHGFVNGIAANGEGWLAASGHNTTTYGSIGAKTKFDGSQGVTLTWESEIANPALPSTWQVEAGFQWAEAPDGWAGRPIAVGDTGVVTTHWEFPTVNVFWSVDSTGAPAGAIKGLTSTSVITCQDCHTGLRAAGPHGANDNWGIDPAFPDDYSKGELTKRIDQYPSGIKLRSDFTRTPTYADGSTMICAKCHDLENYQSGTTVNNPLPIWSSGDALFDHDGETYDPVYLNMIGTRNDGFYVWTDNAGRMVPLSAITIGGGPTSQTWSSTNPQAQPWRQGAAGTFTSGTVGSSNTAHSSHHQDNADGSPQCVNCHIGIPHGWKRPRLLVNTGVSALQGLYENAVVGDQAPYLDPDHLGTSRGNLTMGTPENYTMKWYGYTDGRWVEAGTTTEADAVWSAGAWTFPVFPVNSWNKMGMMTLSAVDNHYLWAGSGSATNPARQYLTGAAYWSEPSCQACNDHMGEDGIRIVNEE